MKRLIPILLLIVSGVVQGEVRLLTEEEYDLKYGDPESFQLNCSQTFPTMDFIIIAETRTNSERTLVNRTAKYMGHTDIKDREGIFEEFETHYLFKFPPTDVHYELWIAVNRYTGRSQWEWGEGEFFQGDPKNIATSYGECSVSDVNKLF